MAIERKKFREIFQENTDGTLTLLYTLKISQIDPLKEFPKGTVFGSGGLGGVNFHQFKYLDIGVENSNNVLDIQGFYVQE